MRSDVGQCQLEPAARERGRPANSAGDRALRRIAYVLVPNFSMLAFTSAIEPLRGANDLTEQELYQWTTVAPGGGLVAASNGVEILGRSEHDAAEAFDRIVVCSGLGAESFRDRRLFGWLRRQARLGADVGAISDGAYILARAGLLDGHRCTVHWRCLDAFRETFPHIEATGELFEIDRKRFTCCGGTGAMDLMLSMVAGDCGRDLANRVAENFIHQHIRRESEPQRMPSHVRLGTRHPKLIRVVEDMENHLEERISCAELAARNRLSERQLERLFRTHLDCTPSGYYLELRLQRARNLVLQSALPIVEVALGCGFGSASHFSRRYHQRFGTPPQRDRAGTR